MHNFAKVKTVGKLNIQEFENEVFPLQEPVLIKGQFSDWPAVKAANTSRANLVEYLKSFDIGAIAKASICPKINLGRFYYDENDLSKMNFESFNQPFSVILETLDKLADKEQRDAIYLQSHPVEDLMPGFSLANNMYLLPKHNSEARLWIGNELRVQTHFDPSYNLAIVISGKREFSLFPPSQLENLYCGPLEINPGGVPISLANIEEPDFEKFPKLKTALEYGQIAEMEAGDALFIPYMWWHHVQSRGPFNVLLNYWWNNSLNAPNPYIGLMTAIACYKSMPKDQKLVWQNMLSHFAFENNGPSTDHIPEVNRGILGSQDPQKLDLLMQQLYKIIGNSLVEKK